MSLANIPQAALYMSKVQFYSCLKLIAAHQSAIPLRQELIASTIALPLPKFSWKESSPVQLHTEVLNGKVNDVNRWRSSSDRSPNLIELARADAQSDIANSDITSTDSEVEQNETEKKPHTVSNPIYRTIWQLIIHQLFSHEYSVVLIILCFVDNLICGCLCFVFDYF